MKINDPHVTYLRPKSKNEFIYRLSTEIWNAIIKIVNEALLYTLMTDTTPDLYRRDLNATILWFVHNDGHVLQSTLRLMEAVPKTGEGIAKDIYNAM